LPAGWDDILARPERCLTLPNDARAVADYLTRLPAERGTVAVP
jgi:hypothetical protein